MVYTHDISIVIVNYNVRHFVVECLESVRRSAIAGLNLEVLLVDNASIDGSVEVIAEQYPEVHLIANQENVGFSKANNQAIRQANGKYILLLNPDTVLQEDTLAICYQYMENHQQVGALGVRMIDGSGTFLPESKRALPTAWNSITKLLGLSSLFPRSKRFNGYALGHLPADERHNIEVLCGAFMFMPKAVLDKIGLLDERFFMYGEDIDLSYRVLKGGYQVHYIPDTTIIHYKGESTKKGSLNYVKTFYNAMGLYVDKHYTGTGGAIIAKFIKAGIWIRAGASALSRLIKRSLPKLFDGALIYSGLLAFSQLWAINYFGTADYYEDSPLMWNIGLYTAIWMLAAWLIGYYKKDRWNKRLQVVLLGTIAILGVYGLLDENYRTSRVIILAGALVSWVVFSLTSALKKMTASSTKTKNILIVAEQEQARTIKQQLTDSNTKTEVIGVVYPRPSAYDSNIYVNNIDKLSELTRVLKADEVIFSTEDITTKEIMKTMMNLDAKLSFKIAGDESLTILGSKSKNTSGEIYDVDLQYNLNTEYHRHIKRVFDFIMAVAYFICVPITLPLNSFNLGRWGSAIVRTAVGNATWVGYRDGGQQGLPVIAEGIFISTLPDREYARHHTFWLDLETMYAAKFIIPNTEMKSK